MLTQTLAKTYTEADYAKFVARLSRHKVEFAEGQFWPVHGPEPLPPDLVDYILSDGFSETELTYPFPMPTERHDIIVANTNGRLMVHAFQDKRFLVFAQGTSVFVPTTGRTRIPDVVVVDKARNQRDAQHRLLTPLVVIEVLSKSTQGRDKADKLDEYQNIDGLQHYLLLSQDQPLAVLYTRLGPDLWQQLTVRGLDKSVELPGLDFGLRLAEVYDGLAFEPAAGPPA
jgi:Uma2 family endonuclease